ncbi:MAG: cell division protein FtsA [Bacteroidales bacterium]|jgi:cell division protein FtsA|nr:cell division protein FtsA [Bacteroidales bacterium]MBR0315107.1 cell division protein FtsA [Bacteroidales bacterium]
MENLIAAIDLGTTKVSVAVGEKTNLGVRVVAFGEAPSKGIKRGRVENVRLATQALNKALKQVEDQIGKKVNKALVGIAGQDIKCIKPEPLTVPRENYNSLITQDEITKITMNTYHTPLDDGNKVLYSVPQGYNVDNYMSVSEPVGMLGRNIQARFKLFVGKENSKMMIENTLKMAGIEPIEVVLEPIASAKAVLTEDEMEVGSILVDIGGGTTDVIVFHHNVIRYAGIIPFGGNSITEDICIGCGISNDKAEYIKTNYGCCFSDYADADKRILIPTMGANGGKEVHLKVLSRIIQARMEEILEAVCWHVEQSDFKDVIRSGMVLTGGGSKIGSLTNLANFVTGYEARLGSPNAFAIDPSSCDQAKEPTSSTAVGMLIHAFQRMEDEGFVYTNCVSGISAAPVQQFVSSPDPVLIEDPVLEEAEASAPREKGTRKKLFGKLKGLLSGESLFGDLNNEV